MSVCCTGLPVQCLPAEACAAAVCATSPAGLLGSGDAGHHLQPAWHAVLAQGKPAPPQRCAGEAHRLVQAGAGHFAAFLLVCGHGQFA